MKKQNWRLFFVQLFSGKQFFLEVIPFIVFYLSFVYCGVTYNGDNQASVISVDLISILDKPNGTYIYKLKAND